MPCKTCQNFPVHSSKFEELGVAIERHATLYLCKECGILFELIAEERSVRFISTEQFRRSYPKAILGAMSWDALKYSLQALAQPAEFQHRLLNVWLEYPSEIAERFVQAHRHVVALGPPLTKPQTDAIALLHARFRSFSGPSNAEHWSDKALDTSSHWQEARQLARACLETFGWPVEEPPLALPLYGEDFFADSPF